MGDVVSTLILRLRDQVSGPAKGVQRALRQTDAAARGLRGGGGILGQVGERGSLAMMAGRAVFAAAATGGVAVAARRAVVDFAALQRRMTYVGLTAGATAQQTKDATEELRKMAQMPGASALDTIIEGVDTLVAAGRSLPEAMSFLPSVMRTAVAANANIGDIATTSDALGSHFKIAAREMQRAFDILVEGGNLGKFELKDMARYLPSLGPAAAAVGFKGAEGLRRFVAVLQTIRQGTGTAEEAAASAMNVFSKMESDETAKRFSKFGVNLRQEMAKARRDGRDLFQTFIDLSARALNGDMSKLPQLFSDQEFARGMRALLTGQDALKTFTAELGNVDGSTMRAFGRIVGDTQDKIDRLSASWKEFSTTSGEMMAPGASEFMERLTLELRQFKGVLEDFDGWMKRNTGDTLDGIVRRATGMPTVEEYRDQVERDEAERKTPALREQREAQERIGQYSRLLGVLEARLEKLEPRQRGTQYETDLRTRRDGAQNLLNQAVAEYFEKGREAAQAEFKPAPDGRGVAPGREDIDGVHGYGGAPLGSGPPTAPATKDDIRGLQSDLNRTGAALRTDGALGPKTEAAIRNWQKQSGLPQTGKWDADSHARLAEQRQRAGLPAPNVPGPLHGGGAGANPSPAQVQNTMGQIEGAVDITSAASAAGGAAMQAWMSAFDAQANAALSRIDAFTAAAQQKLNFTASPTISPTFSGRVVPPQTGQIPVAPLAPVGRQSRLTGSDARRIARSEQDSMYVYSGLG